MLKLLGIPQKGVIKMKLAHPELSLSLIWSNSCTGLNSVNYDNSKINFSETNLFEQFIGDINATYLQEFLALYQL